MQKYNKSKRLKLELNKILNFFPALLLILYLVTTETQIIRAEDMAYSWNHLLYKIEDLSSIFRAHVEVRRAMYMSVVLELRKWPVKTGESLEACEPAGLHGGYQERPCTKTGRRWGPKPEVVSWPPHAHYDTYTTIFVHVLPPPT